MYFSTVKDQGIRLAGLTLQNISRTCLLPPAPSLVQAMTTCFVIYDSGHPSGLPTSQAVEGFLRK